MSPSQYTHAVVIGGSIAGLTAARVLSDHFAHVTILERDPKPDTLAFRSGVPQARHLHVLLRRGLLGFEQFFPGFEQEMTGAGAVTVDFGRNVEWYAFGRWRPHYEPGLTTLGTSRPLIESTLRRRLESDPKITLVDHTEVLGMAATSDHSGVVGIHVRSRDAGAAERMIDADLVVDASGRDSHAADWLEPLGYARPNILRVSAFTGYASRLYERPPGVDFSVMYIQPTPPNSPRGAAAIAIDGGRLHLALLGMAKAYPPTDEDAFMQFLASLPDQRLYQVIKRAKPISPIAGYRRAENVWHQVHAASRWPDNFIMLGDSVAAFNPVYGQGMTVAVRSAQTLADVLNERADLAGFAQRFQAAHGKMIQSRWDTSVGEDSRWLPVTEGVPRPDLPTTLRLGLMKKIMIASTKDPKIAEVFYRVLNMVASPGEFFKPGMLARILRA